MEGPGRSRKVEEGLFPTPFQVRKVIGGWGGGGGLQDFIVNPTPNPYPLDFGFETLDLDLGLGFGAQDLDQGSTIVPDGS